MNTIAKLREILDEERRVFSLPLPENRKRMEIAIARATIAREQSAPTLLAVAEAAKELSGNSTESDDVQTDDYGCSIRDKWSALRTALTQLDEVEL